MARITVLGGTGYAGGHIAAEAAARGHQVTAVSRTAPATPVEGVTHLAGDITDPATLDAAFDGADVVVSAVAPRGEMEQRLPAALDEVIARATAAGVRLGIIGGTGSLLVAPGGPKVYDAEWFPAEYRPESVIMGDALDALKSTPESLDWFYVSPAGGFGAFAPGERTGTYRVGGETLLADAEGQSYISGDDFGIAVVDEIEQAAHRRQQFTVAY